MFASSYNVVTGVELLKNVAKGNEAQYLSIISIDDESVYWI